jgi:tRNA(fMet)-specific endonuclease VapC
LRLALDTNAYAALLRGDGSVLDLLESADYLCIPAVVLGELSAGFLIGDRPERNLRELDAFTADSHFADVPGLVAMGRE